METHRHDHSGRKEITWQEFGEMAKDLAIKVDQSFKPDCIVGVSKGGLTLASVLASMFRIDLYPVRLSYRVQDRVVHDKPRWSVEPPDDVAGCKILIVDEMAVSGRTLREVQRALEEKGAEEMKTCTLYIHPGSFEPDFYLMKSQALVVHPWDKWVLEEGKIVLHPEYA